VAEEFGSFEGFGVDVIEPLGGCAGCGDHAFVARARGDEAEEEIWLDS
jgi:hypothetical protein